MLGRSGRDIARLFKELHAQVAACCVCDFALGSVDLLGSAVWCLSLWLLGFGSAVLGVSSAVLSFSSAVLGFSSAVLASALRSWA